MRAPLEKDMRSYDPLAYLADVLDRIHDHKINRLDELPLELDAGGISEGPSSCITSGINGVVAKLQAFYLSESSSSNRRFPSDGLKWLASIQAAESDGEASAT